MQILIFDSLQEVQGKKWGGGSCGVENNLLIKKDWK